MKKIILVLTVLFTISFGVANAQTIVQNLTSGQSIVVNCDAQRLRVERNSENSVSLLCGRQVAPTATATVTPISTATPVPVVTPTVMPDMIDTMWHEPGISHGDRPAHEHGDRTPQWVLDAGYNPKFPHMAGTPGENLPNYKHTAFKQWTGNFNGQDWFGIFHLDFNPAGRVNRFHSYQLWVRDATGQVSAITGWLDFGEGNNTNPNLLPSCGTDSSVRPIMNPTQVGCQVQFESWYARAGGSGDWAPDFGFNVNSNYYHGGEPTNPATWIPIGGVRNVERRIEFAWYLGVDGIRPVQRGEFWSTQWGNIVSGPNDPVCGTQRNFGERSYTVLCLRQYIAPTLQPMVFPGNSTQNTFPSNNVLLPN